MPEDDLPEYLGPAKALLLRAFPGGLSRDSYRALLVVIGADFSRRNLALLIHHAFQMPYSAVLNDVYGAKGGEVNVSDEAIEAVTTKLRDVGYSQ